jgi:virginiamycin A acetyltransferase
MRTAIKSALNWLGMLIVSPAALACWLERRVNDGNSAFLFWSHVVAQLPGAPGLFVRRAFYRWTIDRCAENVTIGFGALLNRNARLDSGAYIGSYALIGWVWIQEDSLIGSRVSIPSGGHQHRFLPSGKWTPTDDSTLTRVVIGKNTWVGEAAVIMANVGSGCMVAAGAVVSAAVPNGVMVAGNPARFVRRMTAEQPADQSDDARVPALH